MLTNRLPQIMTARGISIRQLARLTGITYTTVRAVYHGERRSIQLEVLEAICQALNVQPGDIFQLGQVEHRVDPVPKATPDIAPPKASKDEHAPEKKATKRRDWRQW